MVGHLCSDLSWNQCWGREEAARRRYLHLQWLDDAHEEGERKKQLVLLSTKCCFILPFVTLPSNKYILTFSCFQNLTGIKGLSEAKVEKICEAAEKIVVDDLYSECHIPVDYPICFFCYLLSLFVILAELRLHYWE